MVLAFRRHSSPYDNYHAALKEIDPEAKYEVTFYSGYSRAKSVQMMGAELQHLTIEINEVPGSLLIEYKKTGSGPGQTSEVR